MRPHFPILALFVALLARAEPPADKIAVAGVEEFTAAYRAWDSARFKAAADLFRRATTNENASCTYYYWLGTTEFHRMLQLNSRPESSTNVLEAAVAMEAALAALTTASRLDERHAECQALLGTLYGMKINGSLIRALRYGPRVAKHRQKALEFGAVNPRVNYLLGMGQFHTAKGPAALREALATLLTAEKLYANEAQHPPGPLEPRWGYDSCLTFIGRTYESLGQRAPAAVYFRRALDKHPADFLAREGLARVTVKP